MEALLSEISFLREATFDDNESLFDLILLDTVVVSLFLVAI